MTTGIREQEQVQTAEIDLEELGHLVGVPIKVRPWWGSHRGQKYLRWSGVTTIAPWYRTWQCSAQHDYYSPTIPRVDGRVIVVYDGPCNKKWGKRTHKHRQGFRVLSVQTSAILIEVTSGTERITRSARFILGVDDKRPYVAEVGRVIDIDGAFEYLKPIEVVRAERNGLEVKRQGDWFFIPVRRVEKTLVEFQRHNMVGKALYSFPFPPSPTRHYAEEIVHSSYCRHLVRGRVSSPDHTDLVLESWHVAVRNRAIRRNGNGLD